MITGRLPNVGNKRFCYRMPDDNTMRSFISAFLSVFKLALYFAIFLAIVIGITIGITFIGSLVRFFFTGK